MTFKFEKIHFANETDIAKRICIYVECDGPKTKKEKKGNILLRIYDKQNTKESKIITICALFVLTSNNCKINEKQTSHSITYFCDDLSLNYSDFLPEKMTNTQQKYFSCIHRGNIIIGHGNTETQLSVVGRENNMKKGPRGFYFGIKFFDIDKNTRNIVKDHGDALISETLYNYNKPRTSKRKKEETSTATKKKKIENNVDIASTETKVKNICETIPHHEVILLSSHSPSVLEETTNEAIPKKRPNRQ